MDRPIHTYPRGGELQDYDDLPHDLDDKARAGETTYYTRDLVVSECVACIAGVCTQRVTYGPAMRGPHIIHGVLVQ